MCGTSRERINKRPSVHRFHLYFPHGCGTLYSPQVFGGADGEEVFLWPIPSKSWLKTAKPTTTTSLRINTKPGSNWRHRGQVHPSGPCEPEGFLLRRQGRRDVPVIGSSSAPMRRGTSQQGPHAPARPADAPSGRCLRLFAASKQDGYSLIPLSIYFRGPRVKLELGLAKGKKLYDKRDSAAARDAKREMDRAIKSRNR